ncbi:MAG: alpha/beta fold hydrolase [Candidatus Brocadiae bacterium]|nr:alpha/beta fold hydrolase [Candidatus Brocadiia bacterium]
MQYLSFSTQNEVESFQQEYPFSSHFFSCDGLRLHYLDEGQGEPLVMVHGNPTWSYYYRKLVKNFSNRYRCIVPDHIGCGMSDAPEEASYQYTLSNRVDNLEALIEHLGLEKITLVLHDWGGMIGMAYASRHPEKIHKIVLFNTAAFPLPQGKAFPWMLGFARSFLGKFLVLRFNAFSLIASHTCCTKNKMPKKIRAAYTAPYRPKNRRLATFRFVEDIPLKPKDTAYAIVEETAHGLQKFQNTPVLICWGGKDFVFDKAFLKEWQKRWPHAQVHFFPEHGHYILEDNTEKILSLMEDFFC